MKERRKKEGEGKSRKRNEEKERKEGKKEKKKKEGKKEERRERERERKEGGKEKRKEGRKERKREKERKKTKKSTSDAVCSEHDEDCACLTISFGLPCRNLIISNTYQVLKRGTKTSFQKITVNYVSLANRYQVSALLVKILQYIHFIETEAHIVARLEYNGMISAHCNTYLSDSSDSPASAS
ncbi:hypothetical protein AAY473_034365 [Plecturocebus cupreus]